MNQFILRNQRLLEPGIALVIFVLTAFAEVGRHQIVPGMRAYVLPWWGALVLLCAAVALSRIWPIVAAALASAVFLVQLIFPQALFGMEVLYFAFLIVIVGIGASIRDGLRALSFVWALGVGFGCAWIVAHYFGLERSGPITGGNGTVEVLVNRGALIAIALVLAAGAWTIGFFLRIWQQKIRGDALLAETAATLRDAEVDLLVSRERDRIAQDVHDIMAHSLSVIIAQADGARFIAPGRPEAVTGSLENIAASARTSLTEVRMLIETLVSDPDGHSNPTLADLDVLYERMRTAGLPVMVDRFGEPGALTATQELASYRIVQEGLTNALKHAGSAASARVVFDWRGQGLSITIASQGESRTTGQPVARGRGIYGMRERARLAGGWLTAGPDDDTPNGYLVTAYVPTDVAAVVS